MELYNGTDILLGVKELEIPDGMDAIGKYRY